MTRKDYDLIAKGFAAALTHCRNEAEQEGWLLAAVSVAKGLEAENPRFDRDRFLRACGMVLA